MAEIEKMSVEEISERVHDVCLKLDAVAGEIELDGLAKEEVTALVCGIDCALSTLNDFYLGGFDETNPEAVRTARSMDVDEMVSWFIYNASKTYHHIFVAEDGEEQ